MPEGVSCSFCSKNQDEVRKIIAGPNVYICDECIDLCSDIIEEECGEEEVREEPQAEGGSLATSIACVVCRLPKVMDEMLPLQDLGFICAACVETVRGAADGAQKG